MVGVGWGWGGQAGGGAVRGQQGQVSRWFLTLTHAFPLESLEDRKVTEKDGMRAQTHTHKHNENCKSDHSEKKCRQSAVMEFADHKEQQTLTVLRNHFTPTEASSDGSLKWHVAHKSWFINTAYTLTLLNTRWVSWSHLVKDSIILKAPASI